MNKKHKNMKLSCCPQWHCSSPLTVVHLCDLCQSTVVKTGKYWMLQIEKKGKITAVCWRKQCIIFVCGCFITNNKTTIENIKTCFSNFYKKKHKKYFTCMNSAVYCILFSWHLVCEALWALWLSRERGVRWAASSGNATLIAIFSC